MVCGYAFDPSLPRLVLRDAPLRALLRTRTNSQPHPEEARSAVSKDEQESVTTVAEIAAGANRSPSRLLRNW